MTGPEQHANVVRDAIWRSPGHVHESSLTALDALVALAERADTLEREYRDYLHAYTDANEQLEQARAEADRLREALRPFAEGAEAFDGAESTYGGEPFFVRVSGEVTWQATIADVRGARAALAGTGPSEADRLREALRRASIVKEWAAPPGPQTKEQT